jgi:threonine/homoserine efflux transporter RhtA
VSLKAFHIVFIGVSILICLGVGVWLLIPRHNGVGVLELVGSGLSLIAAAGLVAYGIRFLRKFRHLSYM